MGAQDRLCREYARRIGAQLIRHSEESHFTLVPHRPLTVVVDGDGNPMQLSPIDTLRVQVANGSKRIVINVADTVRH
jgi:hypothetical protein